MADGTDEPPGIKIIALAHQKGGTGKTTMVCALAAAMVALKPGLKVAVIDLDPQGASTLCLGGEEPYRDGAYDVVIAEKPLNDAVYKTAIENCGLVPATPRLVLSEMDLASRSLSFDEMARHLRETATGFDVIIIDCPSGFGLTATMVMTIADLIIIPTPPAFFAARALRETNTYINRLRSDAKELTAIVLNMVNPENVQQTKVADKIRADWGSLVVPDDIPFDAVIEQVTADSKLLFGKFGDSAPAVAYRKLAGHLAFRLGLIDKEPVPDNQKQKEEKSGSEEGPPENELDAENSKDRRKSPEKTAGRRAEDVATEPESMPREGPDRRKSPDDKKTEDAPGEKSGITTPLIPPPELPEGLRSETAGPAPEKALPGPPAGGGMPRFMKRLIIFMLLTMTAVIVYFAVQADMLAWVMLAYLILILVFFPVLVFLLV